MLARPLAVPRRRRSWQHHVPPVTPAPVPPPLAKPHEKPATFPDLPYHERLRVGVAFSAPPVVIVTIIVLVAHFLRRGRTAAYLRISRQKDSVIESMTLQLVEMGSMRNHGGGDDGDDDRAGGGGGHMVASGGGDGDNDRTGGGAARISEAESQASPCDPAAVIRQLEEEVKLLTERNDALLSHSCRAVDTIRALEQHLAAGGGGGGGGGGSEGGRARKLIARRNRELENHNRVLQWKVDALEADIDAARGDATRLQLLAQRNAARSRSLEEALALERRAPGRWRKIQDMSGPSSSEGCLAVDAPAVDFSDTARQKEGERALPASSSTSGGLAIDHDGSADGRFIVFEQAAGQGSRGGDAATTSNSRGR